MLNRTQILSRAKIKVDRILPYLNKSHRILDVGSGNGGVVHLLREQGFKVTALDIENKSKLAEVEPHLYDGEEFPFPDESFDTVLMLTMLHHTPEPEKILKEARRVCSGQLIVMEDIYHNKAQEKVTHFTDSLVNWEFGTHPHTNKTDAEWKTVFNNMGLSLLHEEHYRFLLLFSQVTYVLEL